MGSLNDIINGKSNREKKTGMKRSTVVLIPIEQLVPNEDNKRSFGDRESRNIDLLAEEMLISGRVLENLVVRKLPEDNRYLILSGHRRYYASRKNVQDGHFEFAELPCEVTDESDAKSYFNLLIANLATEPLTEYEKMTSTMHLREVLPELIGDDELKGRKLRARIAETLHVSQTKVAQYENISNNLVGDAMDLFEDQKMNVSTANDLAGLPDEVQQEFVKDGVAPDMADVKAVRQELRTIHSFLQMSEHERKECALIFNDILLNSDLRKYRDAMQKMGMLCLNTACDDRLWEKYAAEVAGMLLHYRESRQFVGKDAAMYIFGNRRVSLSRYNCPNPITLQFSYGCFFHTFCEIYREDILTMEVEQTESTQMQMEDYNEDDPYEQIIPQPVACDGKCFHCRNTECNSYQAPRDKCLYFDKIDCTVAYVFDNLKKDFPDLYEKCPGCCMRCTVADACKYACKRKDMSIIRERAGIQDASLEQPEEITFSVPREEEVAALRSLMSVNTRYRAYIYLRDTPLSEIDPNMFAGSSGFFDTLTTIQTLDRAELTAHPRWIDAECMGKGRYKVCYAYGELTNTREIQYDVRMAVDILRRAVAIGYFGNDAEMQYVRAFPEKASIREFMKDYIQWKVWFEQPQIGVVYYRVILEDGSQIVVAAYMSVQKVVCNEEYYYIPGWRAIDNIFYEYRISKDNLMEVLMTK